MERFTLSIHIRPCMLAMLLSLLLMTAQVASAASLENETWRVVKSPNGSLPNSYLIGVAAIARADVWAVGLSYTTGLSQALIEHWNGSQWSVVPSPSPGGTFSELLGIAAVSANDIWTVGDYINAMTQKDDTLIEHWNGSQWSIVSSPNAGTDLNILGRVVVISKHDIWAVGQFSNDGGSTIYTAILHWEGSEWRVVKSPSPPVGTCNTLFGIAAASAHDIWAVGVYASSCTANEQKTLIEHWNGRNWSVVPSPNVGTPPIDLLFAVTVVSAHDVWAVGFGNSSNSNVIYTLIEHWNGKNWSIVPSPNVGSNPNLLVGVTAISASDIWTVGVTTNTANLRQTLIEHWNGTRWGVVPSPTPGVAGFLNDVAANSAHDIWAVGLDRNTANLRQTLIEHCC